MIHLDTSFLIRALVRGSVEDNSLRAWLHAGERLAMSTGEKIHLKALFGTNVADFGSTAQKLDEHPGFQHRRAAEPE